MSDGGTKSFPEAPLHQMDYVDARWIIERGLRAFRECWGFRGSLERFAPFLLRTPTKFRRWYYREPFSPSGWDEMALRAHVANALRWYADYLTARGAHWRKEADNIEFKLDDKQLTMWRDLGCPQQDKKKKLAA